VTFGSLFAGIGGFDLALERAGMECRWQVEIDEYCKRVLEKHWPHVKRYGDIRTVTDVERVDVLCGGFPCQDISIVGNRAGIDGERSGLWSEYVRLIRLVRPRYVVVENVAALLRWGMGRVLGDLSESGYNAEWEIISASTVGAPHLRERVWIVAYSDQERLPKSKFESGKEWTDRACFGPRIAGSSWWAVEPNVGRVAHGIPRRVDRLKALGNSIVPQVAELIGRRILECDQ